MIPHEDNPDSIKFYVKNYILNNRELFYKKKVLDLPAGSGITTRILKEVGANPFPYDLFPEFFHEAGVICKYCDIVEGIPEKDSTFDIVICQEGIEHFTDFYAVFLELNRVLKKDGLLIITTPNYSSLQSRLSYLLFESENYRRIMPPNEFESIWFSEKKGKKTQYYFGHVFLVSIQKLRLIWKITGFTLENILPNRVKPRNFFLMIFYPLIYWFSWRLTNKSTGKEINPEKQQAFREQFELNTSTRILLHNHLFLVLRKQDSVTKTYERFKNKNKNLHVET